MTSALLPKASLLAGSTPRLSRQHKPRTGYRSLTESKAKQSLCVCRAKGNEEEDPGSEASQEVRLRALLSSHCSNKRPFKAFKRSGAQDTVDWRSFRAQLVALEQQQLKSISAQPQTEGKPSDIDKSHWIHQIACPEAG